MLPGLGYSGACHLGCHATLSGSRRRRRDDIDAAAERSRHDAGLLEILMNIATCQTANAKNLVFDISTHPPKNPGQGTKGNRVCVSIRGRSIGGSRDTGGHMRNRCGMLLFLASLLSVCSGAATKGFTFPAGFPKQKNLHRWEASARARWPGAAADAGACRGRREVVRRRHGNRGARRGGQCAESDVPDSGHWLMEAQAQATIAVMANFFQ